jgi:3-oxoadipate enol-lactonase
LPHDSSRGLNLEMRQSGNGKPLVLLHSLLCDARAYQHIQPALERGRQVVLPSLPGYGGSPASDGNVEATAQQLRDCLAAAGLARFDLAGNGYGGFVALCFAQLFPDRVDRLMLLDSAAWFPPAGKEGVQNMKRAVEQGGMEAVAPAAMKRLFPDAFAAARPDIVALYREALVGFDPASFAQTCQNLIDVDLRPGLASVSSRTLVVVGLDDGATPPPLVREMAGQIKGARFIEIAGCGHAPHIQEPARTLELIEGFLS